MNIKNYKFNCHPQKQHNEVWLTNFLNDEAGRDAVKTAHPYKTLRLADTAYLSNGNQFEGVGAAFAQRDELVAELGETKVIEMEKK